MNYGRHPWKGNLTVEMEIPSLEELLKKMEITREEARTAMEKTKDIMKRQYNKRRQQVITNGHLLFVMDALIL